MSPGKDWSANARRPSSVAWPIIEVEHTFFRKSLLGTRNRRSDDRQEALGETVLASRADSAVRYPEFSQCLKLLWFCHCLAKCSSGPCQNGGQYLWIYENLIRNLSSDQILIPPVSLVSSFFLQHPIQIAGAHPITVLKRYSMHTT